jgi:hypothetical protein
MPAYRFLIRISLLLILVTVITGCASFGYRPLYGSPEYRDCVEEARKRQAFLEQEETNQLYDRIYGNRNYLPPGETGGELRLFTFGQ